MLISMTGFGRSVQDLSFGNLIVEIQSVNRKHLEIFVSLPKELARYELDIRKWVGEFISRGNVAVRLFLIPSEEALAELLPDPVWLKKLREAWVKVARASGCDETEINLPFLLSQFPPGAAASVSRQEEAQVKALQEAIRRALQQCREMKRREGDVLAKDLLHRVSELERMIRSIEELAPGTVEKMREKLSERIKQVLEASEEMEERLFREIALFAEKVDIAEEITRLHSHLLQMREVIHGKEDAVGRKLDFLVQEIGREINTIGSKSANAAISRLIINCKSELEKIREQIQNIE